MAKEYRLVCILFCLHDALAIHMQATFAIRMQALPYRQVPSSSLTSQLVTGVHPPSNVSAESVGSAAQRQGDATAIPQKSSLTTTTTTTMARREIPISPKIRKRKALKEEEAKRTRKNLAENPTMMTKMKTKMKTKTESKPKNHPSPQPQPRSRMAGNRPSSIRTPRDDPRRDVPPTTPRRQRPQHPQSPRGEPPLRQPSSSTAANPPNNFVHLTDSMLKDVSPTCTIVVVLFSLHSLATFYSR